MNTCGIGAVDNGAIPTPPLTPNTGIRYLATSVYTVGDCTAGEFQFILENYTIPPSTSDSTIFRGPGGSPIPFQFTPMTIVVPAGTCCDGSVCHTDDINEFCCEQSYRGARWFEGRTCDDSVPCPDCLSDAECDDGVGCTVDSCNGATGACEHTANLVLCDDDFFCNGQETCDSQNGCGAGEEPCDTGMDCDESTDTCVVPPIPTVSQWGLLGLTLLLAAAAKVRSARVADERS